MKSVVVTGVSSGIGYGVAKELIGCGYRVFGSVRREADAERLKAGLGEGFAPLVFDVTDRGAVLRAAEEVGGMLGAGSSRGWSTTRASRSRDPLCTSRSTRFAPSLR